jgi:hypothetical protein
MDLNNEMFAVGGEVTVLQFLVTREGLDYWRYLTLDGKLIGELPIDTE